MINRDKYIEWAKNHGMTINKEMEDIVFDGLEAKKEKFGTAYCPCVPPHVHSVDSICPCREWKEEYKEMGQCFCGLFKF